MTEKAERQGDGRGRAEKHGRIDSGGVAERMQSRERDERWRRNRDKERREWANEVGQQLREARRGA